MGWAGGSEAMNKIAETIKDKLSENDRRIVYEVLGEVFRRMYWDTEYESIGIDPILDEFLPSMEDDDEEIEEDECEDCDYPQIDASDLFGY